MRSRALRIPALLLVAFACAAGPCPAGDGPAAPSDPRPLPGETVRLGGEEGPPVRALWMAPEGDGPFPALLLNHGGFDGFKPAFLRAAEGWRSLGYAVAASEYRGQGESEGRPEFAAGEVEDVLELLRWVRERPDVDRGRIGMVGYSHGGTITLLALERNAPVRAAVVVAGGADLLAISADETASRKSRDILAEKGVDFDPDDPEEVRRRDPRHGVARIRVPLLLLHGEDDPLFPASQARTFAEAVRDAGGRAEARIFAGQAHGIILLPEGRVEASHFLARNMDLPTPPPPRKAAPQQVARMRSRNPPDWPARLRRMDLPPAPERPYDGVAHGGIYQRMSHADMQDRLRANLDHPLVAGIDFNLAWAEAEPEEDVHDWTLLDGALAVWGGAGKRVVVNVVTILPRGASPAAGHATPGWVFGKGAGKVSVATGGRAGRAGTADYPLLWDTVYLREYEDFVAAMARRYDGHPAIDAVQIGVGKLGGLTVVDPKIGGRQRDRVLAFYRENGHTRQRFFEAVRRIGALYRRHFRRTPLRLNLSAPFDKKDTSRENLAYIGRIADWAAAEGFQLFFQGARGTDGFARKMQTMPMDRIFHRHSERVRCGMELVNPIHGTGARNRAFMGTIGGSVRNALGLGGEGPETRISYLNLYLADCRASHPGDERFDPAWWEAFLLAHRGLRLAAPEPEH